jgi:biotin synthase
MTVTALIDKALAGERLRREDVERLFAIDPYSKEAYYLQWASHQVAYSASGGKGLLYAQLGLDANPCPGNCDFCSFAASATDKAWDEERALSPIDILRYCKAFSEGGAHLISLMTTAGYSLARFCEIAAAVRGVVHPNILLMANIGDFGPEDACALKEAGIDVVYHAVRIGEGTITSISAEDRYRTIEATRAAGLVLMSGVEPLYAGQDATAVIDRMMEVSDWDLICSGIGTLRTVRGTKMQGFRPLGNRRLTVLSALFRLVAGAHIPYGSENTRWCDGGTNPRDNHMFPGDEAIAASMEALRRELEDDGWRVPTLDEDWSVPQPGLSGGIGVGRGQQDAAADDQ